MKGNSIKNMNRVTSPARILLSILSPLLALNLFADTPEQNYQVTHVAGLDEWSLIFPAEKGKEAYVDYRLALEIIEIECDGKRIEPKLTDGMAHFHYETFPAIGPQIIYMSRYYELRTAVLEGTKFNTEKILEYQIPKDSKRVLMRYRVRYPKDNESGVITILSIDRSLTRKR